MIVTNRSIALNAPIQHNLTYGRGGIRIENNTRYTVYVAVGSFVSPADIRNQAILVLFPYQSRARRVNRSAVLSILASNQPYAINGTINGTLDQVVISEDTTTSPFDQEISQDGLIGDYMIIAGGRIIATQDGLYSRDLNGNEVLAVNLAYSWPWAGVAMEPGDVMIGRGAQSIYWDNSAGTLTVNGKINVLGGSGDQIISSEVSFGSYVEQVYWSSGTVRLRSGRSIAVTGSNLTVLISGVSYLAIDPDVTTQTPQLYFWDDIPAGYVTLAVIVWATGKQPSVIGTFGGTLISGGQIVTGSIVTGNLSATAIDGMVITGATLRTDAGATPDVLIDAAGVAIKADDSGWLRWIDATTARVVGLIKAVISGTIARVTIAANPNADTATGVINATALSSSGSSATLSLTAQSGAERAALGAGGSSRHSLGVRFDRVDFDSIGTPLVVRLNGVANPSGTIPLAKLTSGGSNGSITISNGFVTGWSNPT